MGKKYIIELEEPEMFDDRKFYTCSQMPWWAVSENIVENLTPYAEPDLERVRKEAYDEGFDAGRMLNTDKYEKGINDAWEAARTLWNTVKRKEIFGYTVFSTVLRSLTASEAIEKIREYEQKKQEKDAEIKVGKEFQMGERKCVVTHIIDGTQRRVLWDNGVSGLVDNTDLFGNLTPTGRYFPEIAAVLEKMREGQE